MSLGTDHTHNKRLIHKALNMGINFFDTADLYDQGENEITVGKAFQGIRKEVMIATKVGNQWRADGSGWDWNPSKDYIKTAIYDSLRRLKTDYIDLYQLHGGTLDDPIDETIEAFEELKQAGHIRHYGISSIRPNVIREYISRSNIASIMMQYSLLDRRPEESTLDLCHENKVGVIVRGALAKGLLAGKTSKEYLGHSPAEVAAAAKLVETLSQSDRTSTQTAIHYALAHPAVSTVAAGASTLDQVTENAGAILAPRLSDNEIVKFREGVTAKVYEANR